MTEQQKSEKYIRKQLYKAIMPALEMLSPEQGQKFKEYLEINVNFKKNKIIISLPLAFVRYLEENDPL